MQPRRPLTQFRLITQDLLLAKAFLPQRESPMPLLQLPEALLMEIFNAAQAILGQVRTILTHHPRLPFPLEHRPARVAVALTTHATFDADFLGKPGYEEVVLHKVVARAKTVAIDAAAEVVAETVVFVLQAAHHVIAEGPDEVVEVFVCKS